MIELLPMPFQNYLKEKNTLADGWNTFRKQHIGIHTSFPNLLFQYWGIYKIHNRYHNKYYIGSSTELVKRLIYHSTGLLLNTAYKCTEFKNDVENMKQNQLDPEEWIKIEIVYCQFKTDNDPITISDHLAELDRLEEKVCTYHREKGDYLYNSAEDSFPLPYRK